MEYKVQSFALSDIGHKRATNQDSYLCSDAMKLYVVADGMGGHKGGETASKMAIEIIDAYSKKNGLTSPEQFHEMISLASSQIFGASQNNKDLSGMGTTVTALNIHEGIVRIAQVGDSRTYLIRKGKIWQITEDHSLMNDQIKSGRITREEAKYFAFKNVLTKSVGVESKVDADIYTKKYETGDFYLLCSDGLSSMVEKSEICRAVTNFTIEKALKNLIDLANLRGGDDNITIVGIRLL